MNGELMNAPAGQFDGHTPDMDHHNNELATVSQPIAADFSHSSCWNPPVCDGGHAVGPAFILALACLIGTEVIMLGLFLVFAIAIPLMIWALSPSSVRRRKPSHAAHTPVDATSLPPTIADGSFSFGSGCDAGGGGCDGGG